MSPRDVDATVTLGWKDPMVVPGPTHAGMAPHDLDAVLTWILTQAKASLDAEAASVLLPDSKTAALVFRAVSSEAADGLLACHIPPGKGIAGWVSTHRKPLRVADAPTDPRFYAVLDHRDGFQTRSILAVPLLIRDRLLGVLEVVNKRHGSFTDDDERWVVSISAWAALAIDNARLSAEAVRQAHELTLRDRLSQQLAEAVDLPDLLARAPDVLRAIADTPWCAVVPFSAGGLPGVTTTGHASESTAWWGPYLDSATNRPLRVADTRLGTDAPRSLLILPLAIGADPLGWIVFGHAALDHFGSAEIDRLTPLVQHVALAVHKAQFTEHLAELVEARTHALRHQQHQLGMIHDMAQETGVDPDPASLVRSAAGHLQAAFAYRRVRIWLSDEPGLSLVADVSASDLSAPGCSAQDQRPSTVDRSDSGEHGRSRAIVDIAHGLTRVPLVAKEEAIGLLEVESEIDHPLSTDDVSTLETIASRLAMTIKNARLFDEVARSQRDWETTFDSIAEGVLLHDEGLMVRRANRALAVLLGRRPDEIIGRDIGEVLCPSQPAPAAALRAHPSERVALEIHEADGGRILAVTGYAYSGRDDGPGGRVLVVRDVTDEHRWRARMLQTEKLASLGQLSAGIAHEINNPLGYIHSNLNTLSRYVSDLRNVFAVHQQVMTAHGLSDACATDVDVDFLLQDLDAAVTESQEGVERVQSIVIGLKNFARADAGGEMKPADLHAVLETALKIAWNEIKYKASVDRDFGEVPLVRCNSHRLGQVFINLLVNAAQAITSDGQISLRTRAVDDWVEFSIQDNGSGIAPDDLPRLFDPFYTTKEIGLGTGLGLSVVYGIVQEHGGQIDVASRLGQGTTFTVYLPVSGPPEEGHATDQEDLHER